MDVVILKKNGDRPGNQMWLKNHPTQLPKGDHELVPGGDDHGTGDCNI